MSLWNRRTEKKYFADVDKAKNRNECIMKQWNFSYYLSFLVRTTLKQFTVMNAYISIAYLFSYIHTYFKRYKWFMNTSHWYWTWWRKYALSVSQWESNAWFFYANNVFTRDPKKNPKSKICKVDPPTFRDTCNINQGRNTYFY